MASGQFKKNQGGDNNSLIIVSVSKEELLDIIGDTIKTAFINCLNARDNSKKDILTIKEVQALFSISRQTVLKWCKEGELVSHSKGGRIYFKREEILL